MKKILFSVLILAVLSSCRKDSDITKVIDTQDPIPTKNVESSITGRVFGEGNIPLENTTIEINGKNYTTNQDGFYFINNTPLNANGNYISAVKDGYFAAGKFTFARLGNTDNVDIYLQKKTEIGNFNSSESKKVDFNGGYVIFQPNSIIDANGNVYSGNVKVLAKSINPNDLYQVPGDFRGVSADKNSFFANIFNISAIELQGTSGQKLNINASKPATIGLNIINNAANKPSAISLSYFDEKTGNWVEEGTANLEGSTYVGKVSHFTFWAASQLKKYFKISGQVVNDQNEVLSNFKVRITSSTQGFAEDKTNNQGYFDGFVPADEALKLEIIDNCGNSIFSQSINALTADLDLKAIKVVLKNDLNISGTLVDCNNNPVKNGLIYILNSSGGTLSTQKTASDGTFNIHYNNCDGSKMFLVCYNFSNPSVSNKISISSTNSKLNIGNLLVCNQLDEYVLVNYNGFTKVFSGDFIHDYTQSPLSIKLNSANPNEPFQMDFEPSSVNEATMKKLILGFDSGGMTLQSIVCDFFCSSCDCNDNDKLNLNTVPKPGDYISGYLEGKYKSPSLGILTPYRIDFKVKRDN